MVIYWFHSLVSSLYALNDFKVPFNESVRVNKCTLIYQSWFRGSHYSASPTKSLRSFKIVPYCASCRLHSSILPSHIRNYLNFSSQQFRKEFNMNELVCGTPKTSRCSAASSNRTIFGSKLEKYHHYDYHTVCIQISPYQQDRAL